MELYNQHSNIVIIGNGIAGLSALEAIRQQNSTVPIILISDEKYLTYYRIRLCDTFIHDLKDEELYVHPMNWYGERNIELLLNTNIININPDQKQIILENGRFICYNKLIIATGSRSIIPQTAKMRPCHIYSIRSLDDIKRINEDICKVKQVAVIGGGLLGLECAYQLTKRGVNTKIIESNPRLLARQLDEQGSVIFESIVNSTGVGVIKNVCINKMKECDNGIEIMFNNGCSILVDLVIFAAGVRCNLEVVKGTAIQTGKGIIVNSYMQTSEANVFAAGDVAEYNGITYGLWSTARSQGKIAGINALMELEESDNYRKYIPEIPPYYMNAMGTKVISVGKIQEKEFTEGLEYIVSAEGIYQKLFFYNDKLVGAICIGNAMGKSSQINLAIQKQITKAEALERKLIGI